LKCVSWRLSWLNHTLRQCPSSSIIAGALMANQYLRRPSSRTTKYRINTNTANWKIELQRLLHVLLLTVYSPIQLQNLITAALQSKCFYVLINRLRHLWGLCDVERQHPEL